MLKYFNQVENKESEFELILSGEIGWDFTGKEIADEIRYLNSIGATKIIERINGPGGGVIEALDIVDANINSKVTIETIITGLAASSLGWIAATGTKGHRFIVDYGKGMIHDPSIFGVSLEEMEEGNDKEGLKAIKDSIVTIFSNMTGKAEDEVSRIMTDTTWFKARDWRDGGFADEVITTKRQPIIEDNMTIINMVNACHNFAYDTKETLNFINMIEVINHLELQEGAKSSKVLNAIKAIEEDRDTFKADNEAKGIELQTLKDEKAAIETEKAEMSEKLEVFENATIEANKEKVKVIVDKAKEDGKIKDSAIDAFLNQFGEDFTTAESVMGGINLPVADITKVINGENSLIPAERKEWTFRNWEKNDPTGLAELKDKAITYYKELYKNEYTTEFKED